MTSLINLKKSQGHDKVFPLLELLIVIAIIAILSIALVFMLNPAETLKKTRDAQCISDLKTLKTALGIMLTATSTPSLDGTFGTAATGICTTTGAGGAPTTPKIKYSANVAPALGGTLTAGADSVFATWATPGASSGTTAGKVDGTGWIPVNLRALTGGTPISSFPVDPTNTVGATAAVTDLVYRYACQNGSVTAGKPAFVFEINAALESNAYTVEDDKRTKDGGDNDNMYETGNTLSLLPLTAGVF